MLRPHWKKLWLIAKLLLIWYGITIQLNRYYTDISPYTQHSQWIPRAPWVYYQSWNIKDVDDYIEVLTQEICALEPHNKGDTYSIETAEISTPPVSISVWVEYWRTKASLPISNIIRNAEKECGYVRRPVAITQQQEDGSFTLNFFEEVKGPKQLYGEQGGDN